MEGAFALAWLISLCHGQEIQEITTKQMVGKGPDEAYEDCPCKAIDANLSAFGDDIPSNYGSSCRAWDAYGNGRDTCRVAKPPHYCSMKWCYVEASNCKRSHEPSLALPGVRYSWASCGSINFLDRIKVVSSNRQLKNGLISTGLRRPRSGENRGFASFITYARLLLEDMDVNPDFQVTHYELSGDGKHIMNTNSTYTACVYDLAVGHLDVCLYDFWLTQARINTGAIPVAVFQDTIYVWVKNANLEESFWQTTMKPFLPFSAELWGLILVVLLLHALLMAAFQVGFSVMFSRPSLLFSHIYLSLLGFLSGGVVTDYFYRSQNKKLKPASRIMTVGFSFFCTIAIASFTGSTASFLMNVAAKPSISSLEDALNDRSKTICYPEEIQLALLAKYHRLEKLGVPVGHSFDRSIFQEVNDGICDMAIASYAYSIELEDACGFITVGHPVHSISVGFFVSQELGQEFLFHNSKLKQIGEWAQLERNWLQPNPCQQSKVDEDNADSLQLQATHMMGNCFVLLGCAVLGLLVHFCHRSVDFVAQNSEGILDRMRTPERVIPGMSGSQDEGTSEVQDRMSLQSVVSDSSASWQCVLDRQARDGTSCVVNCHTDAKTFVIPPYFSGEVCPDPQASELFCCPTGKAQKYCIQGAEERWVVVQSENAVTAGEIKAVARTRH